MKTSLYRPSGLACALLATTCLASAALAQNFGDSISGYVGPPAEKLAVTPGGVDIRTGRFAYSETDLSIGGGDDSGGVALSRTSAPGIADHANPFGNFSHNWDILLIERRVDIAKGQYEHGSGQDYRIGIYFGGRSETFESQYVYSSFQQSSKSSTANLTYTGDRASAGVVYTFEATDGTIARFRALGSMDCSGFLRCAYVSEIIQPDGTRFAFEYENTAPGTANRTRLRSVTSTRGYALLLEYSGGGSDWNKVAKACVLNLAVTAKPANNVCPAAAPATSSYTYDPSATQRMASATNPLGKTSSFTYASANGLVQMGFVRPGETSPWLTNHIGYGATEQGDPLEIVHAQYFATGEYYGYSYDDSSVQTQGTVNTLAGGSYTDALGQTTEVKYAFPQRPESSNPPRFDPLTQEPQNYGDAFYQVTPGPVSITDPLGRTTIFDYCDAYLAQALPATDQHRCVVVPLQSTTDPEGIRTELSYDSARNVMGVRRKAKPNSGLPDIVLSATYQCSNRKTCIKPNSVTDARGNVSNATYSPDHGGILTETGPAASNGVRPQTRYSYVQRYAWYKNSAGTVVQAPEPVWLLSETSTCQTSAATGNPSAPCATGGDEVKVVYDYGPTTGANNLQLRGTLTTGTGISVRSCYGYDNNGRRISETGTGANLSSCPS